MKSRHVLRYFFLVALLIGSILPMPQYANNSSLKRTIKKYGRTITRSVHGLLQRLQGAPQYTAEEIRDTRIAVMLAFGAVGVGGMVAWQWCGIKKQTSPQKTPQENKLLSIDFPLTTKETKEKKQKKAKVSFVEEVQEYNYEPEEEIVENDNQEAMDNLSDTEQSVISPQQTGVLPEKPQNKIEQKDDNKDETVTIAPPPPPLPPVTSAIPQSPKRKKASKQQKQKRSSTELIIDEMPTGQKKTITGMIAPSYEDIENMKTDLLSYDLEDFSVKDKEIKAPLIVQKLNTLVTQAATAGIAGAIMSDPVMPGIDDRPLSDLIKRLQAKYTIRFDLKKERFYVPEMEENKEWYQVPAYVRPGELAPEEQRHNVMGNVSFEKP